MNSTLQAFLVILILSASILHGCGSESADPVLPDSSGTRTAGTDSHQLWGLWDVEIVPDNDGSAELVFTPVRSPQLHLNVVGLLESSGPAAVGIDPPVTIKDGILDVDIRLTHPFELVKLTGFDVRGILIGHGAYAGFSQSLFYAGPDDIQLLNADGHTTLWNPTDYSGSGYVDGKLGQPDALENFTATLNGYKYFSMDLDTNGDVGKMPTENRGAFLSYSSNARHYKIKLGDKGLTFQYAIDANWWTPDQPVEVPGSFDVERANCPEPYHLSVYMGPGITGEGGSSDLTIDVFDWQSDCDTVNVEAPILISDSAILTNPDDMGDFVRFQTTLTNELMPAGDFADLLIYGEGQDPDSMTVYADYRLFRIPLPRVPAGGVEITLPEDKAYKTIGIEYTYGGTDYDYGSGSPAPVDYNDIDGPWDFIQVANLNNHTRMALSKDDPEVAGFSGEFPASVTHFWRTQWLIGSQPDELYQAEVHNEVENKLRLLGIYEEGHLQSAVPFDPPIDFIYPLNTSTHNTADETYTVIPFLLTFSISFETWGVGEGMTFVPVSPGVNGWGWEAQPALLTRTIASFETGGMMGQGPLGTALLYEWIADDGTVYGFIMASNVTDSDPNFNESTYEITGMAGAQAIQAVNQ